MRTLEEPAVVAHRLIAYDRDGRVCRTACVFGEAAATVIHQHYEDDGLEWDWFEFILAPHFQSRLRSSSVGAIPADGTPPH